MSADVDADSLPARLRSARAAAGLSQGQAAKLMDLHRQTITEIEAGRRRVTGDELAKFSGVYGVAMEWLLGKDGGDGHRVQLAARELASLKDEDLERVLNLLRTLKRS